MFQGWFSVDKRPEPEFRTYPSPDGETDVLLPGAMLLKAFFHFADVEITSVSKALGSDDSVDGVPQHGPKPDILRGDKSHLVVPVPHVFGQNPFQGLSQDDLRSRLVDLLRGGKTEEIFHQAIVQERESCLNGKGHRVPVLIVKKTRKGGEAKHLIQGIVKRIFKFVRSGKDPQIFVAKTFL